MKTLTKVKTIKKRKVRKTKINPSNRILAVVLLLLIAGAFLVNHCRNEDDKDLFAPAPRGTLLPVPSVGEEGIVEMTPTPVVVPKSRHGLVHHRVAVHGARRRGTVGNRIGGLVATPTVTDTMTPTATMTATQTLDQVQKAAAGGDTQAAKKMGNLYLNGQGVAKNYAEALKYHLMAAQNGDAESQYCVGLIYDMALGVNQDYQAAMSWYTLSAKKGDSMAENAIGYCYETGHGVTQNNTEALKWYQKAANHGNTSATQNILSLQELMPTQPTPGDAPTSAK
jgi:TPR repeat protein